MKISLTDLKLKLETILRYKGLSAHEAEIVAEPFIRAELSGKKTHGITKFFLIDEAITMREGRPEIIKDKMNYALIDAHKELGYITAQFACDQLIEKAKKFDNAFIAVNNSYYFSMAGMYAEKIADAGFISVVLCNGGPAAVAPFGGVDPVLGTNPISIGIPTMHGSIVLDMATSAAPWGEINLAKLECRSLADKTFLDTSGEFTSDPQKVEAIIPFGGHKGAGLNFMFEILTGAFVSAKMGLRSKNGYDLGFLFMAFSPDMFSSQSDFNQEVEQLVLDVKNGRRVIGVDEIFIPGEKSGNIYRKNIENNSIEINEKTLENLDILLQGGDVKKEMNLKE